MVSKDDIFPIIMLSLSAMLGLYWFGYAPSYVIENPQIMDDLIYIFFTLLKYDIIFTNKKFICSMIPIEFRKKFENIVNIIRIVLNYIKFY